jgi:pimeloyl-ACP methyl ester carboxylesterase
MDLTADQPRSRRIDLPGRGGSVAALEMGPADRPIDVVFSHANGFNARTYRSVLAEAARRLRILAFDLRGHGMTDLPTVTEGRAGWDDIALDLQALLAALDLTDVVLAGHSMGATTSLLAAAETPQRVRALALFEPVVLPREAAGRPLAGEPEDSVLLRGALRRRNHFASPEAAVAGFVGRGAFASWPPQMVADYVAGGLRPQADGSWALACAPAWEASNYRAQGHDPWAAFARVDRPIRILRAGRGSTAWIDAEQSRLEAGGLVRVATVPGTSHFLPMERPDLVTATLAELAG